MIDYSGSSAVHHPNALRFPNTKLDPAHTGKRLPPKGPPELWMSADNVQNVMNLCPLAAAPKPGKNKPRGVADLANLSVCGAVQNTSRLSHSGS
jgi:hypothetical protein